FCKTKNEEWILSGIASILEFGDCPELLQEPTDNKFHFFKPAKTKCNSNRWALPTIETLENLLKIRLDQL
ncbi:MAG: hypothetical protein Q7U04_02790, partial [Bacteriovorax sp.]|nr:hypothetical protein [Bacteriovorax sp.]